LAIHEHLQLYLINYLNKYYGEKVIILIDEYDAPIINAFDKGYYNEAIEFFLDRMNSDKLLA